MDHFILLMLLRNSLRKICPNSIGLLQLIHISPLLNPIILQMIGKSKYNFRNRRLVKYDLCQSILCDFPSHQDSFTKFEIGLFNNNIQIRIKTLLSH